ncbi:MAG: Aminodeoxychorismate/anthranilate synthase component 2 [Syntrophomonadaceae bacterium]|nr:Aminodeoxychorismate/anthranilate synthase component 2 [Bacillota bacterium]
MLAVIDNYDSFTYNLVQLLGELGAELRVWRNDAFTLAELESCRPEAIVISPGPGHPEEAGLSLAVIRHFAGKLPILGVCLGHQAIGHAFGGQVVRAPEPVHGKPAEIWHNGDAIFYGVASPFKAGRYHSLVIRRETLPECLEVTAGTPDGLIMAVRHKTMPVFGVQFHPESVITPDGRTVLKNFWRGVTGERVAGQAV